MKFKTVLFAALSAAVMLSSCGNAPDDRESASAEAAHVTELEFYDRFSNAEVENMAFSKLGLFSLTCDYDTRDIRIYKDGEEFEVICKLTNMTGMTIDTELQIPGGSSIDDMARLYVSDEGRNPIATGWAEEKTFQPYETYEIPIKLTIPDGAAEGSCHLAAGIGIQVFNEDITERMQLNYCSVSMGVMYVP
ncbi:MAG: hypothetical protein K2G87_04550, partial [Oscillospiraceae bacterium]|nr:hypothetical protein [Oscillospiraceae bacterium]